MPRGEQVSRVGFLNVNFRNFLQECNFQNPNPYSQGSDTSNSVRGDRQGDRKERTDRPVAHQVHSHGHDRRHQRSTRAQGRADRTSDHQRLSRSSVHRQVSLSDHSSASSQKTSESQKLTNLTPCFRNQATKLDQTFLISKSSRQK